MKNSIISKFERITLRQCILRLLTAWIYVVLYIFISSDVSFTNDEFYANINFPIFVFSTAVIFLIMCMVENEKYINIALISGVVIYSVLVSLYSYNYMFSFGLCLVACIVVCFSNFEEIKMAISEKALWTICLTGALLFALFVGITCCFYYINYRTPCFDFGIFAQMFYYMKETGECLTTCERDGLLSHFAVHFSPIYYLIVPIYYLFPSPCTLLVVQGAIVASGAIPVMLLCKHHKLSNTATVCFISCYLLYPAFLGGCYYYLHENCFLAPLLLWFIYFSEKNNSLYAFVFAFLTLTVKEDASLYIAVAAMYFIFTNKNYKCNLFIFIFAVIYFVSVIKLMSVFGEGVMSDSRYGAYIYDNGGLFTVIKSVLQNPGFAIKMIFKEEKLLFFLQTAVPLCFLPFCINKPSGLILLIPYILVNFMTDYRYQYDIGFQYAFGSGALLFYLAIKNYSSLKENRRKLLLCSLLCSLIIFSGSFGGKILVINDHFIDADKRNAINEAVTLIPDNAKVAASTFILPNLSQREVVYELETTDNAAEYYIVDLRRTTPDFDRDDFFNSDFELIYYREDIVALYRHIS